MLVYKCDACGSTIPKSKDESALAVGFGMRLHHLCKKCAAPIVRILKKYKLVT